MRIDRKRFIERSKELLFFAEQLRDTCIWQAKRNHRDGDDEGFWLVLYTAKRAEETIAYVTNRPARDVIQEALKSQKKPRATKGGAA